MKHGHTRGRNKGGRMKTPKRENTWQIQTFPDGSFHWVLM